MQQLLLDFIAPPPPTLDGFVPGRNGELLALFTELAAGRSAERFIYLWGEPGAGKSHLLRALAGSRGGVLVQSAAEMRIAPALAESALLAIDDVDRLSDAGAVDLFHVYNAMRAGSGTLLLASGPCPPAQLPLRPDLMTRLAWGLCFQLHPLTDAEKIAALQTHAEARGFRLGEDVGRYLLRHWRRDMASLFAALDAMDRYSLETQRPVSVPLLREAVGLAGRKT